MQTKYQLILIGEKNPFTTLFLYNFLDQVNDLGLNKDMILVIDNDSFKNDYMPNAPVVCLYFGTKTNKFKDLDIVNTLIENSSLIIPIVNDIKLTCNQIPQILCTINAFELANKKHLSSLVSLTLEGFNLLRFSRRLFISYRRNESTSVAIQLYEKLEQAGFDVFLDTHSIRPGEVFQDELWHRLVDTDVVVLLNTPDFLKSYWTVQELTQANAMSIGILQLIWPKHEPENASHLTSLYNLIESDFEHSNYEGKQSHLLNNVVENIIEKVEFLRARTLFARQNNLITEFINFSKDKGIKSILQKEKIITIDQDNDQEFVIIPTVGLPQAFIYNKSDEFIKMIRSHKRNQVFLLYDDLNIREKWLTHLTWLNLHLPVKSIKITESVEWLKKLKI